MPKGRASMVCKKSGRLQGGLEGFEWGTTVGKSGAGAIIGIPA